MGRDCCYSENSRCCSCDDKSIPTVSTTLSLKDYFGAFKVRWGIGRMNYKIEPGLYAIGKPDGNSPVLVSANYKLTFDVLRKNLVGLDCRLLILDTKGVNVWCAAGKGTFGTDELVNRIQATGLSEVVTHKRLILPQLGASGVNGNEAIECFNNGFNCAQAILSTYCEQFGLDGETARKLSCGFGAGMGRLGETCGAVTGAYMLIGLKYGQSSVGDSEAKERTYRLIQEFSRQFIEHNQSTNCRELLGVDLLHGDKQLAGQRVQTVCPKAVKDAAEILENILEAN